MPQDKRLYMYPPVPTTAKTHWRVATAACLGLCLCSPASFALGRITQVTVFPGSATVERLVTVEKGTQRVVFDCLPASVDVASLQLVADADVRLGELRVDTVEQRWSSCAKHPLDTQITSLEDQKAAVLAERDALEIVKGYLKSFAGGDDGTTFSSRGDQSMRGTVTTLQQSGQDTLLKLHQLNRKIEALDKELNPLLAERNRTQSTQTQVVHATASVYVPHDAEIRLTYRVRGPSWQPAYRAMLNTQKNTLQLERQALVVQATGEDWNNVKLKLATGQPNANAVAPIPRPWQLDIATPQPIVPLAAPAPMMMEKAVAVSAVMADSAPDFTVATENQAFHTEFVLARPMDVPSNGQKVALTLGEVEQAADVYVRTSPAVDARAYVLAQTQVPEGVWPNGPVQLYRNHVYVGSSYWQPDDGRKLELSFGQDEQVHVKQEPEQQTQEVSGLTGSRLTKKIKHAYNVQNKHNYPVTLQLFAAAPVALHSDIEVTQQFNIKPTTEHWNGNQGLMLWQLPIKADDRVRITGDYSISSPKKAQVVER